MSPSPTPIRFTYAALDLKAASILVGEARSKGPELDVQGEIYPGLNLILAYTNQSTAITKAALGQLTAGGQGTLLGQPFPGIPRNVATLSGTYEFQDGTFKGLKLGATYHYNGASRVFDNTGYNLGWLTPSLAGYGTVDLLADYPFYYDGWKLNAGVNVHNLLDRTYYTSGAIRRPSGRARRGLWRSRASATISACWGISRPNGLAAPPPPNSKPAPAMTWVHDWTGPYAGVQIGMDWGDNGGSFSYVTPDGYAGSPSFDTNGYGVLAGAHLGYNQQFDHLVLGLEASADVTDLNKREQLGWSTPDPTAYYLYGVNAYCNAGACGGAIDAHISSDFQGSLARPRRLCLEPPAGLWNRRSGLRELQPPVQPRRANDQLL